MVAFAVVGIGRSLALGHSRLSKGLTHKRLKATMTTNSRWRSNAQFKLTRNSELHTDVPAAGVDVRRRYQCGDALHQRHSLDQRWHCSQVLRKYFGRSSAD